MTWPTRRQWQWRWRWHLANTFKEQFLIHLTIETFEQSDEKTGNDQQKDDNKYKWLASSYVRYKILWCFGEICWVRNLWNVISEDLSDKLHSSQTCLQIHPTQPNHPLISCIAFLSIVILLFVEFKLYWLCPFLISVLIFLCEI